MVTGKARCVTCGKEKATTKCGGCSQDFCFNHLTDHRQELGKQFDEIEVTHDLFRQILTDKNDISQNQILIQQINEWECNSIKKVQQSAENARQIVFKHTTKHINKIEMKLNKMTEQLRESRQENDFFEADLKLWKEELERLTKELHNPLQITFEQISLPLVSNIYVDIPSISLHSNNIAIDARWIQNGITVAGGNGRGNGLNQLTSPVGLYVDDDQTIYASDYEHHRIMEWKYGAISGQIVAGGNGVGNRNNQLNGPTDLIIDKKSDCLLICDSGNRRVMRWPRRNGTIGEIIIAGIRCSGLTMDNNEYLYVSDYEKHEVRRWRLGDTHGTVVAGGNGQGYRLDQLNVPTRVFVDHDYSVYVSDSGNHRVMKWIKDAKEGIVVAGGQNQGDSLTQLSQPQGVIVDRFSTVYVSDWNNHRIMRWVKGATKGCIVVGKNGKSKQANQLDYPVSLSFDQQNNLYIADRNNNRVQKFEIESS